MKENVRKLDGLVSDGEDLFINGNLYVEGPIDIRNAVVIVCGDATFKSNDNIYMHYVDIIVAGKLSFGGKSVIATGGGDISANEIHCFDRTFGEGYLEAMDSGDSDIYVKQDFSAAEVIADRIFVGGDTDLTSVKCTELVICGENNSTDLSSTLDIYIGGNCSSGEMNARDIFIGADVTCSDIIAQNLYIEGKADFCCAGLTVGNSAYIGGELINIGYVQIAV